MAELVSSIIYESNLDLRFLVNIEMLNIGKFILVMSLSDKLIIAPFVYPHHLHISKVDMYGHVGIIAEDL